MGAIWRAPPFLLLTFDPGISMWKWLEHLRNKLSDELFLLAVIICWKAWEIRNREIHDEDCLKTEELVTWCNLYLYEFQQAQIPRLPATGRNFQTQWNPPPDGFIEINFDAAVPQGESFYSVSMVARDREGECRWWAVRRYPGHPRAVDCEAHAALKAINIAKTQGWTSIILEGDCLQVIEALNSSDPLLSSFGAFLEEVLSIAKNFVRCNFQFIKRSGNQLAHDIATKLGSVCREGFSLPHGLTSA
ncbi:PREDICTED: uncharacterized protein LOC105964354 [Erythranthe guttata]|uniref:uncharacterized protein LOC105964354 n=1 Tax=Erythranthe guttata TaxID=4155 RepID=UPI00064DE340|nr:PREDICTED: uncharacterized protein LOC105964354 [Erythranthe guttata]|eukprot:XP_012844333.1 PREDICTED: uncharacterized protein LOC105964354 [Erythranthe guttata]